MAIVKSEQSKALEAYRLSITKDFSDIERALPLIHNVVRDTFYPKDGIYTYPPRPIVFFLEALENFDQRDYKAAVLLLSLEIIHSLITASRELPLYTLISVKAVISSYALPKAFKNHEDQLMIQPKFEQAWETYAFLGTLQKYYPHESNAVTYSSEGRPQELPFVRFVRESIQDLEAPTPLEEALWYKTLEMTGDYQRLAFGQEVLTE